MNEASSQAAPRWQLPAGAQLLDEPGPKGGNILLRLGDAVLKLYRSRGNAWYEALRSVLVRIFERKRGITPWARHRTERRSLALWEREGFEVPRRLQRPLPRGLAPPGLWLEFCPGPTLSQLLEEQEHERVRLAEELGRRLQPRHRRALALREPLLLMEHATTNHIFIDGDRWVSFDLENGYCPGFPVLDGLVYELSSFLRALAKRTGDQADAALRAFVRGYNDPLLLEQVCARGLDSESVLHRLRRWSDQRRRESLSKTAMLVGLRQLLALPTAHQ